MTNFLVSLCTVPPLLAYVWWDDATTLRQPIGKSVGKFELGAGCSMSWCERVLVYERRKARRISPVRHRGVARVGRIGGGGKKTHSVLTVTLLVRYAFLGRICQSGERQVPCPI